MKQKLIVLLGRILLGLSVQGVVIAQSNLRIAVIPKGTTHVFWKSVEAGARRAGEELGVEIVWKGPIKENDRAQQIAIVEQFVNEGVSGIVLAPLDHTALARPVAVAGQKKIPVVIFDSSLRGEAGKDFVSFVATDNKKGGSLGGEHLGKLLGGKGKVVLLRYMVGSASTMEREEGFLESIDKLKSVEVTVKNRFAGPTAGEAKTASMNIIDRLREADGVFCPNESSTFGMLLALRQNNLAGKVRFVGFDTSPPLVEALQKGEIDALVAQDPTRMGYEAVTTIVKQIRGAQSPPVIDTGVQLITRGNLNDPKIKALLGLP
ncbi:MAG: substrate-binding domain-containing protein [Ignavibacteriales bacterium]|nr:substrate-binding domain-containing protein [Ignavibacteriales bacterium]